MPDEFWSHSRTNKIERCGIAYERHYELKDVRPSGLPQLRGTCVHEGVRANLRSVIEKGEPLPVENLKERVAQRWDDGVRKGVRYTPKDKDRGLSTSRNKERENAIELVAYHAVHVAPLIDPMLTEERVTLHASESLPKEFRMIIDVIEKDGSIRDTKTAAKMPGKGAAAKSMQLGTYQLGRLAQGEKIPVLKLDTIVRRDSGSMDEDLSQAKPFSTEELNDLVQRHRNAMNLAAGGIFVPAPADAWWCGSVACEYGEDCPFAADRRKHATIVDLGAST